MAACEACGSSSGGDPDSDRRFPDFAPAGERGVVAECDRRGARLPSRSLGRALRGQRSRWWMPRPPRAVRRLFFFGFAPMLLFAFSSWALIPPADGTSNLCPASSDPTVESIPPLLENCGVVRKLDLTNRNAISLTVYAPGENDGGRVPLRRQVSSLMRSLHQVALCFPAVKIIQVNLLAPGPARRDDHGHELAGAEIPLVSLLIATADLRGFSTDFDWSSFSIYAANRYLTSINYTFGDAWHRELQHELNEGDFVSTL
jgi:hypothetical protein